MRKVYVDAIVRFTKDGDILPIAFIWEDGRKYMVDRVLDKRRAASLKVGGQGIRYKCRVYGREVYLYFEGGNRWFIESAH